MTTSDTYGRRPLQMDDYGMAPSHYDCCNNCNGQDNHEPEKTEEDETTDLIDNEV